MTDGLALPADEVMHRWLATKVSLGYQIQVMVAGKLMNGFPIGLDEEWLQLYEIGKSGSYPRFKLVPISKIELMQEIGASTKTLSPEDRDKVHQHQRKFLAQCKKFLNIPEGLSEI